MFLIYRWVYGDGEPLVASPSFVISFIILSMCCIQVCIKNYIQARSRYTERKENQKIQWYNCQVFGHFSANCKNRKVVRNITDPWRRSPERYNQISDEPHNKNDETIDHQRLNYMSNEPSVENETTKDRDFCYVIREYKKSTSEVSQGKVNGKEVKIIRDTGCSCIIVNNKLVKKRKFN